MQAAAAAKGPAEADASTSSELNTSGVDGPCGNAAVPSAFSDLLLQDILQETGAAVRMVAEEILRAVNRIYQTGTPKDRMTFFFSEILIQQEESAAPFPNTAAKLEAQEGPPNLSDFFAVSVVIQRVLTAIATKHADVLSSEPTGPVTVAIAHLVLSEPSVPIRADYRRSNSRLSHRCQRLQRKHSFFRRLPWEDVQLEFL